MPFMFSSLDDDKYDRGSMFGPKMGSWWVRSEKDKRWNANGRGYGLVTTNGPGEINEWLENCDKLLGDRPDDLEIGFMKD